MRTRTFGVSGASVSRIGQGSWYSERGDRAETIAAFRRGLDLGLTHIDTAEMYADGGAEQVVADAIAGRRDEVFLVSKVYPHNAGGRRLETALDKSLRRLKVETIDWYLLHWRGAIALEETVAAMEKARAAGKIRHWGVSNLDVEDLQELGPALEDCATDQVLYNLEHRGVEFDLLPSCAQRGLPVMAYSPVGQGGKLLRNPALLAVAARHGATPAQVPNGVRPIRPSTHARTHARTPGSAHARARTHARP